MKPTIIQVHGALAESASWSSVIQRLHADGYPVVAAPNPLRSLSGDAAVISSILATTDGLVVLIGHSYGGAVTSNAAVGPQPRQGAGVRRRFRAGSGREHLRTVRQVPRQHPRCDTQGGSPLLDGTVDLYIQQEKFHQQFAADVSPERAVIDAAAQRPLNTTALNEGSGNPAWKSMPSWFVYPELDYNIPLKAHRFMAERAGACGRWSSSNTRPRATTTPARPSAPRWPYRPRRDARPKTRGPGVVDDQGTHQVLLSSWLVRCHTVWPGPCQETWSGDIALWPGHQQGPPGHRPGADRPMRCRAG